jgi:hypothetical protein
VEGTFVWLGACTARGVVRIDAVQEREPVEAVALGGAPCTTNAPALCTARALWQIDRPSLRPTHLKNFARGRPISEA